MPRGAYWPGAQVEGRQKAGNEGGIRTAGDAPQAGGERAVGAQIGARRQKTDATPGAGPPRDVNTIQENSTPLGFQKAGDTRQQQGFAGACPTEHRGDTAARRTERYILHRRAAGRRVGGWKREATD